MNEVNAIEKAREICLQKLKNNYPCGVCEQCDFYMKNNKIECSKCADRTQAYYTYWQNRLFYWNNKLENLKKEIRKNEN